MEEDFDNPEVYSSREIYDDVEYDLDLNGMRFVTEQQYKRLLEVYLELKWRMDGLEK